jgi:hypothetical protein
MHTVEVFIESHWAVKRPELIFKLNEREIFGSANLVGAKDFQENIIYEFEIKHLDTENNFKIELVNKTDQLVTEESDHWVEIKNIYVDGVSADWLLFEHTTYRHSMPDKWVADMKAQGIDIAPEYYPGTVMRLNGVFNFKFENPFLIRRILEDWHTNI